MRQKISFIRNERGVYTEGGVGSDLSLHADCAREAGLPREPVSGFFQGGRGNHFVEFARRAHSEAKIRPGCRIVAAQGIAAEILVCPAHEGHTRLERIARFFAALPQKMRPDDTEDFGEVILEARRALVPGFPEEKAEAVQGAFEEIPGFGVRGGNEGDAPQLADVVVKDEGSRGAAGGEGGDEGV
jgi:hypothetical protein